MRLCAIFGIEKNHYYCSWCIGSVCLVSYSDLFAVHEVFEAESMACSALRQLFIFWIGMLA